MNYKIEYKTDVTILHLEGELDATTIPEIRPVIEQFVKERRLDIIVDFSRLTFLDSSGASLLISMLNKIQALKGTVKVQGLKEQPASVFRLLRLDTIFP